MSTPPKSQSIPIRRNIKIILEDEEEKRDVAMADYRDYMFCNRLVHGIQHRQQQCSVDHKYQTQALINHIICTRNAVPAQTQHKEIRMPLSFSRSSNLSNLAAANDGGSSFQQHSSIVSFALSILSDEEDEMIFEMEM